MDESLAEVLAQLVQLVGASAGEVSDEHVRWDIYLKAMANPDARGLLLRSVGLEPDPDLATSIVLRVIEDVEEVERSKWVNSLGGGKREYAHRRALELSLLERILSGEFDMSEAASQINDWTDWLQLRLANVARNDAVLNLVGQAGRTRRIRNIALSRRKGLAAE